MAMYLQQKVNRELPSKGCVSVCKPGGGERRQSFCSNVLLYKPAAA